MPIEDVWSFLRDEQNREILYLLGAALGAMGTALGAIVLAGWTVYQEIRSRRQINQLAAEVEQMKASQGDILRAIAQTAQRHDILFGAMIGRGWTRPPGTDSDEHPES